MEISDFQWARIIRSSCGKKKRDEKNWEHLDIPGYWWLLVLGKRNPLKIVEIFRNVRAELDHTADEKDEEIIREVSEELSCPEIVVVDEDLPIKMELEPVIEIVPDEDVSVQQAEIVATDYAQVMEPVVILVSEPVVEPERIVSNFRIGDLNVSEIEIDHIIDELFEEPAPDEFEGMDLSRLTLEDLFEPEESVIKQDRDVGILKVFLKQRKKG